MQLPQMNQSPRIQLALATKPYGNRRWHAALHARKGAGAILKTKKRAPPIPIARMAAMAEKLKSPDPAAVDAHGKTPVFHRCLAP